MGRSIVIGTVAGVFAAIVVLVGQGVVFHLAPVGMSYAELAATLLGASAVLLAIIGVFVAALAVWGFTTFRSMTESSAKAHVDEQIQKGELRTHLETVVTDFLKAEFKGGDLRKLFEKQLDEILVSAPADRAKEAGATEDDAPVGDL